MRILHLTLKKKWFDMVASGEKKEEYREIKNHWILRLCCGFPEMYSAKDFDVIEFKHGYSSSAPVIKVKYAGMKIATGKIKWGAKKSKIYFVIKLGKSLKHESAG
jgi:hypothetical protein